MNYSNKPVCIFAMTGLTITEQEEQGRYNYYIGVDYNALSTEMDTRVLAAVTENIELKKHIERLERRIEILEHRMI